MLAIASALQRPAPERAMIYTLIDEVPQIKYRGGIIGPPYIEIFSRRTRAGWDQFGDQVAPLKL